MEIKKILDQMTIEEKAGMCSGKDFWHTKEVERLGVKSIMVSDGPHGLRKQALEGDHLGAHESIKAVCFPTGCTIASSFDRDLIYEMGQTIGNECQAEDLAVILGPAVNIKRSPLCGRNFEYFSEDPYLCSTMAAAQIKGVQSQGVGTSIKHFLANSQEHRRMTSDSQIDERTLREIYLASFETAVKEAKPWTVMCSYNKVNGVFASENHRFLTQVLRDEWKFDGFVMSDWGAVNDRVEGVKAGLDLEMPSSGGVNDQLLVDGVKDKTLDESVLDTCAGNILNIVDKYYKSKKENVVFDRDADHQIARRMAGESMVLLKNEDILPLNTNQKVAFIGEFAKSPRYQGGGSSHINSHKISSAFESVKALKNIDVTYAKGYNLFNDSIDETLIDEAVETAEKADVAVIFAGLTDAYESEGYDRHHMKMPKSHNHLIEAVAKKQSNVIVVLHNGSPVEIPWADKVKGILEAYLAGQAVGEAVVDILYGDVNPSGKLAETFPLHLEDNPSYLYYLGEGDVVEYREGIFVGYRYYDKKNMNVRYPFGYGLSYTTFEYSNLEVSQEKLTDEDTLEVKVTVKNTGSCFGKEVVQLYVVPDKENDVIQPIRELKGYTKVALNPGESKTVKMTLDKRSFAYFDVTLNDWHVPSGSYGIEIGASSRDIRLHAEVEYETKVTIPATYHMNSTIGDIMKDEKAIAVIQPLMKGLEELFGGGETEDASDEDASKEMITKEMREAMFKYMPLRALLSFGNGAISLADMKKAIDEMNQ